MRNSNKTKVRYLIFTVIIVFALSVIIGISCTLTSNNATGGSGADSNLSNYYTKEEIGKLLAEIKISLWSNEGDDFSYNKGNVGIGTTNPTEMLEVNGNVKATKFEGFGIVPIGSIVAWHANVTTPALELPDGWVKCEGGTISDPDSPIVGKAIPDLNTPPNDNPDADPNNDNPFSKGVFLRGYTTSGEFEHDAFQGHNIREKTQTSFGNAGDHDSANAYGGRASVNALFNRTMDEIISDGTNGTPRTSAETRPVNMSVVWIMRIK